MVYTSTYRPADSKRFLSLRTKFILACLFFKLSLDIAYFGYLSEAFNGHFLTPFYLRFSLFHYIESYLWLIVVAYFIPFSTKNLSGIFFASAFLFLLAPLATVYGMDNEQSRYAIALTALALFVSYFTSAVKAPPINIPSPRYGYTIAITLCLLSIIYFLAISFLTGTAFRMNFDIGLVYEFRTEMSQALNFGIFGYLNLWTQKIFTPFLLAVGLHKRNWVIVCICLAMELFYFGVTQHRQHLFVPALVFFAWYVYKRDVPFTYGIYIAGALVILSTALIIGFDLHVLGALIVRRAFFVAASVTDGWIHFFIDNPKVYFSDNLLSALVSTQYTGKNLPRFIGDQIVPNSDLAYNAGLIATGFAQLGIVGVTIYSLIFGLYLRTVNSLIRFGVPAFIPAAILFLPIRTAWTASDLFTSLLSHGLIVGLLIVWLYGTHMHENSTMNEKLDRNSS